MIATTKRAASGLSALALIAGLAACGETASTKGFSGESQKVAQTVANFQSDASANNQKKLCQDDLAATLTNQLSSAGGCQAAIKEQLKDIDSLGLTIESVAVTGSSALARVKSTYSGKNAITTLKLVKEGSDWKISGISYARVSAPTKKS
ncbi:MAG: hypothetical protein WBV85_03530 [Solirubrobacteraceae bacterium]